MRKTFPAIRLALCALCALSVFGLPAHGQDERERIVHPNGEGSGQVERETATHPNGAPSGQEERETTTHPNGIVQDWSRRHAIYPRFGPIKSLIALQRDPRALLSWQAAAREDWHRANRFQPVHGKQNRIHRDWTINLGTGGTAAAMYPAKFTFDINAAPSCLTDFVVYPVNANASATQPNIVAFNNLYSGTTPSNGICNRAGPPPGDDGVSATTFWSYNIAGIPGGSAVLTSPALSLDGTKVAFVETSTGSAAHFHVLAWKSGDGVDATNRQNVLLPAIIPTVPNPFVTQAPVAGSGHATDLVLGVGLTPTNTLSSPYVDYNLDVAYVGDDSGILYRIKDVFCTVNPACAGGSPPAPSLDTSWNLTGSADTLCGGTMTGPVLGAGGNVYVGCSDGSLYGFDSTGVALLNSPLIVGDGSATGGIVDPPMLDGVNGLIYVVSGSTLAGTSVLVQATVDLSSAVTATLGTGGAFNLHEPAFNDAYFSGIGTPLLYALSEDSAGLNSALYGVGFTGSVMNSIVPASNIDTFPIVGSEFSPATEVFSGGHDRLFESNLSTGGNTNNFVSFIIDAFPGTTKAPDFFATVGPNGTSGIVVDNAATGTAQAASVYFSPLGTNSAVKLTQVGLF